MQKLIIFFALSMIYAQIHAQVSINTTGNQPDPSAMLDIQSSSKGLLLPRMTTAEMDQITNPAVGLLVLNTDSVDIYMYNGTCWLNLRKNSDPIYPSWYFACGMDIDYGGQTYGTVQIGSQCWMSENLNIGNMITGNPNNDGIIEKYCYNNNASNCNTYGGLYTWNEMMQYSSGNPVQGICPPGWHIPSEAEWCTMTTFIDPAVNCSTSGWSGTTIGNKLRSTSGWYSGWNGSDAFGFAALPAGVRSSAPAYLDLTTYAYWWSSEPSGASAWNRRVTCYQNEIGRFTNTQTYAISVRCVKD